MRCSRCGADNPPTDKYCGQCGNALEEQSFARMAGDAVGLLMMITGTVILALAALYHIIPLAFITDQGWWLAPPPLDSFLSRIFFLTGEGLHWPGLTVGALLGILGLIILVWPRVRVPGRSGKGIRALLLIGGLIIFIGMIVGAFPAEMAGILTPEGRLPSQTIYGQHAFVYRGLVMTGLMIVLSAAVWASWKGWLWWKPSTTVAHRDSSTQRGESER